MTQYGEVVSQYDGPFWKMTFSGITFEMPFTRQVIELSPFYSHLFTWITAIIFVFFVVIIAPLIKPTNKATQKKIEFWHFFALCIYSGIACFGTLYLILSRGELSGDNLDAFYCNTTPDWHRVLSISFTLSKYWEWIDTAILVWNGKSIQQIGFLHFYHHMTTVFLFAFTMMFPGTDKIGLLLNGFVHMLMYYHYAFRLPKIFRPIITICQIVQLFLGTFSHYLNITRCKNLTGYIEQNLFEFYVPYLFVPVYLLAFCHFFYITYIAPAPTRPQLSTGTTDKTIKSD